MSGWSSKNEAVQVVHATINQLDPVKTGLVPIRHAYNMTGVIRDYLVPGYGGGWKPVQYDESTFHDILFKNRRPLLFERYLRIFRKGSSDAG